MCRLAGLCVRAAVCLTACRMPSNFAAACLGAGAAATSAAALASLSVASVLWSRVLSWVVETDCECEFAPNVDHIH